MEFKGLQVLHLHFIFVEYVQHLLSLRLLLKASSCHRSLSQRIFQRDHREVFENPAEIPHTEASRLERFISELRFCIQRIESS